MKKRRFSSVITKLLTAAAITLAVLLILNCVNSYKIVKAINNREDNDKTIELINKPKAINGVNMRPFIFPFSNPMIGEIFGDVSIPPLHVACYRGNLEIVKALLENGADVNIIDYAFGCDSPLTTTLAQEEEEERFKIANYLIANGADINYANSYNQVPLTLCLKRSYFKENTTEELKQEQMELFIY